jgi:hypothetical protein
MTLLTIAHRWNGNPARRLCLRPHAAKLARHSQGVLRHRRRRRMHIFCVEHPLQAVVVGASKNGFCELNFGVAPTRVALLAALGCYTCYAGFVFRGGFFFFLLHDRVESRRRVLFVVVVGGGWWCPGRFRLFRLFRASIEQTSTWLLKPSIKRTPS